jgi:hypothetical protein
MSEAAAALTASFIDAPPVAVAEPEAVEAEAPEASEQPAAEEAAPAAPFDLNPELPEDLAAEIAEAEIDEQVEEEVAAYEPETDEWGNPQEVDQDSIRELVKLRKQNEFLQRQVVQTKAGQWKAEGEKFFPLAKHALDDIAKSATSRRAFLKAAKAEHDRILPHVQTYLAEAKLVVDDKAASVTEEARAEVATAWGKPLTDPDSSLTGTQLDAQQRIDAARERVRQGKGQIRDIYSEMLK